jgi:hypothetical protein
VAIVAMVVVVPRGDARACELIADREHTVDPTMQATDQTPPTLPAIPAPKFHHVDDPSDGIGCGGSSCGQIDYFGIPAVATDDVTSPYKIGLPPHARVGHAAPQRGPADHRQGSLGDVVRVHFDLDTTPSMDFTLRVVAIDLAGNEERAAERARRAPRRLRMLHRGRARVPPGAGMDRAARPRLHRLSPSPSVP